MNLQIGDSTQPGEDQLYTVDLTFRDYVHILVALQMWNDRGGYERIDDYEDYFTEAWPMTPDEVVQLQERIAPTRSRRRLN